MSEPFNVVILAGGSGGPLTEATGVQEKATLTIHDQPMLDWVVNAFHGSPEVNHLVVVGSGRLDTLRSMAHVRKVKRFTKVLASLDKLAAMRKNRKDPHGILRVIGCQGQDFSAIETALSKHLDAKVRILISPHPEMGMDVDKPADDALARKRLLQPDM